MPQTLVKEFVPESEIDDPLISLHKRLGMLVEGEFAPSPLDGPGIW
jgi:hypothetical protein